MPLFSYTGRNAKGQMVTGIQEASNEPEAVRILQGQSLVITKVAPAEDRQKSGRKKKMHQRVKLEDLLVFTRETSTLLEAGIPLLRALEIIEEQTESKKLEPVFRQMIEDIRAGSTLKDAIAKHPQIFPSVWVYLIQAGEVSGNLTKVLLQIADYLESSINFRRKLVSALAYPAILVLVAIGAIFVFLFKVIPVFEKIFNQFHAKLPALTVAVIQLSKFLRDYFPFLFIGLIVFAFAARRYLQTPSGKKRLDGLVLRLPVFGELAQDAILTQLSLNLMTLIKSGVNILQSLEIASRATGNWFYQEALERVRQDIQQGKTLSDSLKRSPLFSPIMIHMITIGEESGKLTEMMEKVAAYYKAKVDVFLTRLGILIEPMILIFIGGIVGVLVFAMFMPIIGLSNIVH